MNGIESKLIWRSAAVALILTGLSLAGVAAPTPSPQLADLLNQIDFHGAGKPEVLGKQLAQLPPADLATLCDMVVEPGTDDDTKPRMALEGLAWYVGSQGTPAQRAAYIDVLCTALQKERPAGVKAFLIRQLQLVGDERAVATLGKLLADQAVWDYAAQALLQIRGDGAIAAFRAAYPEAQGPRRVGVVEALGALGDHESRDRLVQDALTGEPEVRFAALSALANMGEDGFWDAVGKLQAQSHYERSQIDSLVFRMSERLLAQGEGDSGTNLATELQRKEAYIRCAALYGSASAKAVDLVLSFLTDQDAEVRAAASDIAVSLKGEAVTQAYLARLSEAPEAGRAAIVEVLGKRGDAEAAPAILSALQDQSKAVRLAAANAAAALGQPGAVGALVKLLTSDDPDQVAAVQQALTRMRTGAAEIALALKANPPGVRAMLLKVLADSRAQDQAPAIYDCLADGDEAVCLAALRALEALTPPDATPQLLRLLPQAGSAAKREACESALIAVCRRSSDRSAAAAQVVAALNRERLDDYCSLLRVLGQLGGRDAFAAVRTALEDPRSEVGEAAFRALSTWPDPAAAEDILQIAVSTPEVRNHVLALRAYVRLIAADAAANKLAAYEKCINLARRPDERKLLLSKMGELPDGAAVSVLQKYLLDEHLQNEAAAALLNVAERLLPAGWATARQAVNVVNDAVSDEGLRQRAREVAERIAEFEDFVTRWQVAGPFEQGGLSGLELLEVVFPPEQAGGAGVNWQKQVAPAAGPEFWYIDLNANPGMGGSNRVAYLRTWIDSPRAQPVQFELGSDDAVKVWVNGEMVHRYDGVRGCERGQDKVAAQLKKGRNEVLLKVANGGGAWAACLRVRNPDGTRIEGLKIDLEQ